jgi:trigger factor
MSAQDYVQQVVSSGSIPAVVADVARGKALALVVEKAAVTDQSGNVLDLVRLRDDGTLADPADIEAEEAALAEAYLDEIEEEEAAGLASLEAEEAAAAAAEGQGESR